jgi:hypothetical protein
VNAFLGRREQSLASANKIEANKFSGLRYVSTGLFVQRDD